MKERMALPTLTDRPAGVLLHITSLPGPHGSGDLGDDARAFIDWAARAGLRWWQILPFGPAGYANSPYSALSAFAGNPMFISLGALVGEGLLAHADVPPRPDGRIDFGATNSFREAALRKAFAAFGSLPVRARAALDAFAAAERRWLEDWSLYAAIKRAHRDGPWVAWPEPLR